MEMKVLITGVCGQAGSYMAEYLLENIENVRVFGVLRPSTRVNSENMTGFLENPSFTPVCMDLCDPHSVSTAVGRIRPDYVINFAAQSFVGDSWENPVLHFDTNARGVLHLLEAVRVHCPKCRFYQSSSSECFGEIVRTPQDEYHPLRPLSPYGAAKCAAEHMVRVYRKSYGLYAVSGFCFNFESPRRHPRFVTRKISMGVAKIHQQMISGEDWEPFQLGNLSASRDWSHAEDVVDAIWRMLNQEKFNKRLEHLNNESDESFRELVNELRGNYVVASGETRTVADFVHEAFQCAGIDGQFHFDSDFDDWAKAAYVVKWVGTPLVTVSPKFFRPADVESLAGDSTRIREELGWKPKHLFKSIVSEMVHDDIQDERVLAAYGKARRL